MKRKEKKSSFFTQVYEVVRKIPKGKVATYGQIAKMVGTKDARKVGYALHANKDINTPCHRVVNRKGGLSESFSFDGYIEQKRRLIREGVRFIDQKHVDLERSTWKIG